MHRYIKTTLLISLLFLMLIPLTGFGGHLANISADRTVEASSIEKNQDIEIPVEPETNEETPEPSDIQDLDAAEDVEKKIAYLTFDDGPSSNITPQILDTLDRYQIKATFFVVGKMAETHPHILKRIHEEGHFVSNHSYSHDYKKIYASPAAFIEDIKKCDEVLASILGESYTSKIIRFPAGSFGKKKQLIREAVKDHGYEYLDWNALNGDAEALHVSTEKLVDRIVETTQGRDQAVILMHDSNTKHTTAEALPAILDYLQVQGYVFKTLEDYTF
ncbi:polysaccharide deacetylase family protein [Geosporobacter ferrireducens]|uniref:NodB homology domain-containing protein n=1 Tax=Geosporobacter ferrireducens TaxID=1424294 RepID=A0A1D8GBB3_9FIRM|nr:polysaccharide deacetylase family protein [Geosporobacter ferrireducens]AOT68196.1 hypothetical protein Gferi_00505 [Geosporobacter ferrireducens]